MKNFVCRVGLSGVVGWAAATANAAEYYWDNGAGNGLWNEPLNWSANLAPTASDGAWFRQNVSPSGTVRFSADGFAQYIRHDFSRAYRTFTIDSGQTVNRTLTLSGNGYALIDLTNHTVDVTFDGTPNANGARLRLQINGSGTSVGTRVNKAVTLRISCDVSGPGGFTLTAGVDGPGRLLFSGQNTYTGPTVANSGVLLVNGVTAASPFTINAGGILGGIGTIGGPVTVNPGGLISPGVNSQAPLIGTLTVSNSLTLAGDLMIEVNKSQSPSNDTVFVTGTLTNAGSGFVHVLNYGPVFVPGDRLQLFNQPLANGQTLKILSAGRETWTNKLAVDGSIEVLAATNTPITGNPTRVFTWKGAVTSGGAWRVPMSIAANWVEGQAPAPGSSNVFIFQGDILVPYNWPFIDTNYGTSILIFSNNTALNSIKILAGSNNTVRLGSFVRQDTAQPCYYGITGTVPIKGADGQWYNVTCANFTNELGDASCGSQTEFQCTGGRLDVYGVLRDGAGTSSRLVKSGPYTLNLTGNLDVTDAANDANTYTGGTIVNAGPIKMAKRPGMPCIPGDVTVNGTGSLVINVGGGEQIADTAVVTLNDFGRLDLAGQPETVQTVQGPSPSASVVVGSGTLTVAPSATQTYNGGPGVSEFFGSLSGSGTVRKNGSGTWALLGNNAIGTIELDAGTLRLNGNSGTGNVTVQSGATLLAQGTVAGPVTVAAGGTLGAGLSVGKLTLGAGANLSAGGIGATNVWELGALKDDADGVPGTDFDQIVLTGGTLALGAATTLEIRFTGSATPPDAAHPFWQARRTWRIFALSGGTNPGASNFGRIRNGVWPAGTFTTSADASGILLTFTPADPRPRITGLTGAGGGSVTVHYTNTVPGRSYVLSANTNLADNTWLPISAKTAIGTGDSQTDPSATNTARFYRVHGVAP